MTVRQYLVLLSCISVASGYKILLLTPVPTRSHDMLAKGLARALLEGGHEVTWATPYKDNKPKINLRVLDLSHNLKVMENVDMSKERTDIRLPMQLSNNITRLTVENPGLREVLLKEQFDAVITEWFLSDADAGYAAIQGVPWIVMCSTTLHSHMENLMDDIRSIPTVPLMMTQYSMPMSFLQRLGNSVWFGLMFVFLKFQESATKARYESYFSSLAASRGVELPPFEQAVTNISILLVNSHPSIAPALSVPPNVIDIGGFHIDEAVPLPKDIEDLLDNSPQGVIFFSLGSIVKSSSIPKETMLELVRILGTVKMTVLWKLDETPQNLPSNVHVRQWWPQAGILAHKNTRLFITHGGLLSTIEAVHYGVPLLAVPVFGDQPFNALRAAGLGFAKVVPFPDLGAKLEDTLWNMLEDDQYYNRAKFLSRMFKKRPASPRNLISHYVELAIESKGAYHLRSVTHLYKWYERWMLDQLVFVLATLYVVKKAVKMLFGLCRRRVQKKIKKN